VDVLVRTSEGDEWVVQCKRYRDTAGESIIRELYGTMVSEKADRAVLVTTAEITAPARAWARGKPIDLVDGGTLLKMIEKARQRADGTVLDRMAHGLENLLFTSQLPPPALRAAAARTNGSAYGSATASAIGNAAAPTRTVPRAQPPARLPHGVIRYHRGAPVCPNCSMPMLPRPRTAESTRTLYRCRNYPRCRVVLEGIGD
jgi:restriction system protein